MPPFKDRPFLVPIVLALVFVAVALLWLGNRAKLRQQTPAGPAPATAPTDPAIAPTDPVAPDKPGAPAAPEKPATTKKPVEYAA
jgi:hypothetical protein